MTIFELVRTKNDEGLTITEMIVKRRMKVALNAFKLKKNEKNTRH